MKKIAMNLSWTQSFLQDKKETRETGQNRGIFLKQDAVFCTAHRSSAHRRWHLHRLRPHRRHQENNSHHAGCCSWKSAFAAGR